MDELHGSPTQPGAMKDLSTLAWVQDELRRSMEGAHKALRRALKDRESSAGADVDAVDPALLRNARHQLHQGVGALELVGLPAAAQMLRASELAVQRLASRPALLTRDAADAVERASFALLEYLGRLLGGMPVSPVAMFPQYRVVMELAGAERVHPADLWPEEWRWRELDADTGVTARDADAETQAQLEAYTLDLMRRGLPGTAVALGDIYAGLAAGAADTRTATLWRLAAGVYEGQAHGLLAVDNYTKRLGSRLLSLVRSGEGARDAGAERLAQDLLFFCAQSESPGDGRDTPRLAAVRHAYGLAQHRPVAYLEGRLGRFDPAWVAQARKRVAGAKDGWSSVAGGELHRLAGLGEQFSLVAESLRRLYPAGDQLADELLQAIAQTVEADDAPTPALAMEVATSLLYVEASLEEGELDEPQLAQRVQRLAARVHAVRTGRPAEPLEGWMEALYRRVSDRQTMGSVVQELRIALGEAEKLIDQYFRNPDDRKVLIPVPHQLAAMRGVLSVLGLDQASAAVLRMRETVDDLIGIEVDHEHAGYSAVFEKLAGNLGALGFLIDMLSVQPKLAKSLFVYDAEAGTLNPVMGRQRPPTWTGSELPGVIMPVEPRLIEQAQSLAVAAAREDVPTDQVARDLERLSQHAIEADQPALASAAAAAQAALDRAEDAQDESSARAQVALAMNDFVASVSDPAGLEPLSSRAAPLQPAAPVLDTGLEDDAEMREVFLEEAREVVAAAAAAIDELNEVPDDIAQLTAIRRAFHTLKGSSRMVGLKDFGEAAWACEQLYNARLAQTPRADDALLGFTADAVSYLADWVEAIARGAAPAHDAQAVRLAADALRQGGARRPLPLPGAPIPDAPFSVHGVPIDLPSAQDLELGDASFDASPAFAATEVSEPEPEPADAEAGAGGPSFDFELDLRLDDDRPEPPEPAMQITSSRFARLYDAPDLGMPVSSQHMHLDFADPDGDAELIELDLEAAASALPPTPPAPPEPEFRPTTGAVAPGMIELDLGALDREDVHERSVTATVIGGAAEAALLPEVIELPLPPSAAEDRARLDAELAEAGFDPSVLDGGDAGADPLELDAAEAAAFAAPPVPDLPAEPETTDDDAYRQVGSLRIATPLFNIYLNEADELSRRLSAEVGAWAALPDHAIGEDVIALAHSLAGNSATVGYSELSRLARAFEHALMRSDAIGSGTPDEAALFVDVAEEIRRLLHQFAAGFLKSPDPTLLPRLDQHEFDAALRLEARSTTGGFSHTSRRADLDADSRYGAIGGPDRAAAPEPVVEPVAEVEPAADFEPAPEMDAPVVEPVPTAEASRPAPALPVFATFVQADLQTLEALPLQSLPPLHASADALDVDDDIDAEDAVDAELFPIFEEEAQELLPALAARLRDWSAAPDDTAGAQACMRTLHTLKGGARLAGAMRLGELAHRLETAIDHLSARGRVQSTDIEPLQARADTLAALFEALRRREVEPPVSDATPVALPSGAPAPTLPLPSPASSGLPPAAVAWTAGSAAPATSDSIDWSRFASDAAAAAAAPQAAPSPAGQATLRMRAAVLERLVNQAGEIGIIRARMEAEVGQMKGALRELTENLERLRGQLRDIEFQAETQIASRMEAARAADAFDPLEFDRYTRFQELTRSMAESVNDVATVQRSLTRTMEAAEDGLAAQSRLTRDLQDDLLRTRMVEFESLSDRLYRVVRQAAKETGRQVRLDIEGGSIEVDRGVLDRMTPAFEHLLRNCVTHGIEPPEVRAGAGKDPTGAIVVALGHEANEVTIEFRDDGQGLDLERIRAKGEALGLLPAGRVPTDADLANLIFMPGFSTAETVTELAGRGVGLDVVRSDVGATGGRIQTATARGQGTSFKLVLPLTTAVTKVVMLRCDQSVIAVPATLVESAGRSSAEALERAYADARLAIGGEALPFFWLGALLQQSARGAADERSSVVVVRSAQQRLVLHVDEVLGYQDVVVKPLGPQLARMPGLAGMTLLPAGKPALIYNPVALAALYGEAARLATAQFLQAPDAIGAAAEPAVQPPTVLVVDDSLTVRRVTQRLLVREGYRVVLAKDGQDALERLAEGRPDVVLSDIEMPRMDGFDFVRHLRGDERWAGLPVIMITSRIAQKHRDMAAELGVDHYLGKPYSEEELLGLIQRYAGIAAH